MSHPFDTTETDRLLSTTRAVRKRLDLDRPVESDVLLDCIRLAVQAPTGSNAQGWRWVIVTDADKRAKLAEFYRSGGEAYMRSGATKQPASAQQARVQDSAQYLVEVMHRVPVLVIPCIKGRVRDLQHAAAFFGSIHPAIWSFQLALRSRGLGAAWTTFHLAHEQETAELLGIPDDVTQAAMLPVAYTIGTEFKPARRGPVEEITFWDTWEQRTPGGG